MPKRIEPLSSRAQVVAKAAEEKAPPAERLAPPRRMSGARRSRQPAPVKPKRSFWRSVWIGIQICFLIVLVAGSIVGYFIYQKALEYYTKAETYDLKKLDDVNVTSTFYDINGEELGRIFIEDRVVLKPEEIPDDMRHAVMSAEDRRFYQHGAIDYKGIVRAAYENFEKKSHSQGGSSIEQQLAKHVIGDFSRTMDRKFLEAFVAMRLERALTKDQILNYYMNRIYFGKGYFGVGAAARGYFGKEANQLTVPECALLAGIIRAPTSSSPRVDIVKAKWRRDLTLHQMLEEGYIQRSDYLRYIKTPVTVQPAKPSNIQSYVMAEAVKEMEQILSIEGTEDLPQGLTVRTNIDLHIQHAVEDQLNAQLIDLETGATPPGTPSTPAKPPLQGAAIVADVATGRVYAWVGGRDFSKSQFDHISMARRENGSLLQPLIYALGFDRLNLHPASMINASYIDPTATASAADLALGNPMVDLSKWFLSIQDALALGNKAAATRVGLQIGPREFGSWLKQAGLEQAQVPIDKPNVFNPDPMTLGDVTSLYQILGNGGMPHKLKIIQSIQSRSGDMLYEDTKEPRNSEPNVVLNNLDDAQMTLTLQNALRAGPARSLATNFKSGIAGMPAYSEGYRDAWFVGYSPKLVTGVWVGYDDSRPIGSRDVAVRSAVPLWNTIMQQVESRLPSGGPFPVPPELTKVEIDRTTGALRGLAGLAPAPDDIFVYLKKSQIEAAGNTSGPAGQQIQAPKEWSDWLTTMFNEADETGISPEQAMNQTKRPDVIPSLAEYKMPALRGDILSSDGVVYATTGAEKNLVLGWPATDEATTNDDIVHWMHNRLDEVQKVTGITLTINDADLIAQYQTQRYQPYQVLENVTPDQVSKIQAAGLESKGFGFQIAPLRKYPNGPQLAHVLGYLSRNQQRNKGKYLSGDIIYDRYKGATGIESVEDQDLTGKDGSFMISTTPEGYARSAVVKAPATYGNNVRLSIDSKIQADLEQAMANSTKIIKAGVIMDIHTGDVLALASHPTFDPNIFVPAINADEWAVLNNDPYTPLLDRAIRQYPPGSGFKTVTSIAAMRAGVFDPNWIVHCPGYLDVGSVHFNFPKEHGDIDYLEGFTHSYNTYFMSLGLKVGRDILLDTARSLNFGNLTGIDLPGELPGLIPDNEFTKRVHNRDFGSGDLANSSIGQGDILATPIQMVSMMAAIANGGTIYRPRLIKQIEDRSGNVIKEIPVQTVRTVTFDEKWMPSLKAAMINVIDDGTATVVHRDDMKIAAKTGTAQVGSKEHPRQIAWLSGYFPADDPKYSFCVLVEGQYSDNHGFGEDDGLLGGVEAGSIVKDIIDAMYPLPGKKKKDTDTTAASDAAPEPAPAPAATKDATTP